MRKSHPLSQVPVRHGTSWNIRAPFPPTFTVNFPGSSCALPGFQRGHHLGVLFAGPRDGSVRRTQCGAPKRQLSWFITPKTMVYDTQIGAYKPINITGGSTLLVMRGMAQMSQINCGIISSHFVLLVFIYIYPL